MNCYECQNIKSCNDGMIIHMWCEIKNRNFNDDYENSLICENFIEY